MAKKSASEVANEVVHMDQQAAEALIAAAGYASRVVTINGVPRMVTKDIRNDRIGLSIDNGIVTAARVG